MKSMNQKAQAGFTLIELMIVVAIIGILAAVAIPQYSNYTTKAKLANAVTVADSLKTAVALCVQETGDKTNCDEGTNGIPDNDVFTATKEVGTVDVTDGKITLNFADDLSSATKGKAVSFAPNAGSTAVTWEVTTTVDDATFKEALTKNSVAAPVSGGGDAGGGDTPAPNP